jgi:hypothetical protein
VPRFPLTLVSRWWALCLSPTLPLCLPLCIPHRLSHCASLTVSPNVPRTAPLTVSPIGIYAHVPVPRRSHALLSHDTTATPLHQGLGGIFTLPLAVPTALAAAYIVRFRLCLAIAAMAQVRFCRDRFSPTGE